MISRNCHLWVEAVNLRHCPQGLPAAGVLSNVFLPASNIVNILAILPSYNFEKLPPLPEPLLNLFAPTTPSSMAFTPFTYSNLNASSIDPA